VVRPDGTGSPRHTKLRIWLAGHCGHHSTAARLFWLPDTTKEDPPFAAGAAENKLIRDASMDHKHTRRTNNMAAAFFAGDCRNLSEAYDCSR